jgi:hypothetical protein
MFLKSGCLGQLLLQIHEAKHEQTGRALYNVIAPSLESHHPNLSHALRQMLM